MDNIKYFKHIASIIIIPLFIITIAMFFYVAQYNTPSIWDDFCFALTVKKEGFWQAQKMYYNGWSGRYLATFIYHTNPLIWTSSTIPFMTYPILLLISLICSIKYFLNKIFNTTNVTLLTISFTLIILLNIPSLVESFFWYSGTYTLISGILIFIFSGYLINYFFNQKESKGIPLFLISLYFIILGSSEIAMVGSACFVGLIFILSYLKKDNYILSKFSKLAVISLLGSLLVITAPGNSVRKIKISLKDEIINTFSEALTLFIEWTVFSPFLIMGSIAYLAWYKFKNINVTVFNKPIIYIILIFLGVFISMFIPTHLGIGQTVPPRGLNLIYIVFLIGWLFVISSLAKYIPSNLFAKDKIITLFLLLLVGIVFAIPKNKNFKQLYRDVRYDRAKLYHLEYISRVKYLKESKDKNTILTTFINKPETLYTGDLLKDPTYLFNRCVAEYFDKDQIIVEEE